jgi:hypothetical protein
MANWPKAVAVINPCEGKDPALLLLQKSVAYHLYEVIFFLNASLGLCLRKDSLGVKSVYTLYRMKLHQ